MTHRFHDAKVIAGIVSNAVSAFHRMESFPVFFEPAELLPGTWVAAVALTHPLNLIIAVEASHRFAERIASAHDTRHAAEEDARAALGQLARRIAEGVTTSHQKAVPGGSSISGPFIGMRRLYLPEAQRQSNFAFACRHHRFNVAVWSFEASLPVARLALMRSRSR